MTIVLNIERIIDPSRERLDPEEINALRDLHPSDVAETLEQCDCAPSRLVEILSQIGNHKAVEAFTQLSMETQEDCLEAGNTRIMLTFLENMEPDDRVDLLKAVDDDVRERIMPLIEIGRAHV